MYQSYKTQNCFQIMEFFTVFEHICDSSYTFSGELHDFWEILIVLDGQLQVLADEHVYFLTANQLLFHKPMEFHNLKPYGDTYSHYFVCSFNTSGDFMKQFSNKLIQLSETQRMEFARILDIVRQEGSDAFHPDIFGFLETAGKDNVLMQRFTNSLELFLIMLSESIMVAPKPIYDNEALLYKKAVNLLDTHLYSAITVDELARQCNVSTSYLKRIFTKFTGIGIHEYFLQSKILCAKKLLSDGLSVTEVADRLSFSSQNYFSIVFKRKVGISPLQYKKGTRK